MATMVEPSTIDFSKFLYITANGIIPRYTIMPYIKYKEGNTRFIIKNEYEGQTFDDSFKNQISPNGTDWQFMLWSGYFADNINRMVSLGVINLQPGDGESTEILKKYRVNYKYVVSDLIKADTDIDTTTTNHKDFLYNNKCYDNWQYIPFYTYGDFETIDDGIEYNYSVNFDKTNCILKITRTDTDGNVVETKEYPFDAKVNHLYMLGSQVKLKKSLANTISNFTSKLIIKNEDHGLNSTFEGNVTTDSNGNLKCTQEQFNIFKTLFSMIESEHKWQVDSTPETKWIEINSDLDVNNNVNISWSAAEIPAIIKKYLQPQSRKCHYILKRNKSEIQYSTKYKMFPYYNKKHMNFIHRYIYEKDDYRTVNTRTGENGINNFVAYYKFTPVIDLVYNERWNLFPWQSLGKSKTTDFYDTNNRIYYTGDKKWIEEGYDPYWNWDKRFSDYKCGMWNAVKGEFSLPRGYDFSKLEDYSNGYYTLNTNTITSIDVQNVRYWSRSFTIDKILEVIKKYQLANQDGSLITNNTSISTNIHKFLNNRYYIYGKKITEQELLTFLLTTCMLTNNLRRACAIICTQYNSGYDKVFPRLTLEQFYAVMSTVYITDEQGNAIIDSFYYNSSTGKAVECPYNIGTSFTTCTYDKTHLCGSVYEFYINKKNLPLIEFVII